MQFFMHQLMNFYSYVVSAALIFWSGIQDTVADVASTTYNSNIAVSAFCNGVYDQVALLDSMANVTISTVRADLCNRASLFFDNIDTSAFAPGNVTTAFTNSLFGFPTTTLSPGHIFLTILSTIGDFLDQLSILVRTLLDFLGTDSGFALLVRPIMQISGTLLIICFVYEVVFILRQPNVDSVEVKTPKLLKFDSRQPKLTSTALAKVSRTPPAIDLSEQLSEARKAVAKVLQDLANLSLFHRGVVRAREGVVKERGRLIEGGR